MLVEASENEEDKYKLNDDSEVVRDGCIVLSMRFMFQHLCRLATSLLCFSRDIVSLDVTYWRAGV